MMGGGGGGDSGINSQTKPDGGSLKGVQSS